MCATLFWIRGRLVVAVANRSILSTYLPQQGGTLVCFKFETCGKCWIKSGWTHYNEEIQYLLDLATAFRHTWKSLFWRWRLVWHGPGTWVPGILSLLSTRKTVDRRFEAWFMRITMIRIPRCGNKSVRCRSGKAHQTTLKTDDGPQPVRHTFWNSYTTLRQLRLRRHDCRDSFRMFQVFMWILIYFRYTDILFILWKYMVYQALHAQSVDSRCVQFNMFRVWSVPVQKQCQVLQHGACLGIGAVLGCVCLGAVCSKGI